MWVPYNFGGSYVNSNQSKSVEKYVLECMFLAFLTIFCRVGKRCVKVEGIFQAKLLMNILTGD